jgi:ornithine decarboxylase
MAVKVKEETENGVGSSKPFDLLEIAEKHGTPVCIFDHEKIRANYREFKEALPRVQAYFAVRRTPIPR